MISLFLWLFACWDCGFKSHREHGCLSVVSVMFCQVGVSATYWSRIQRSPTNCDVLLLCDLETSRMRRPWPVLGRSAKGKMIPLLTTSFNLLVFLLCRSSSAIRLFFSITTACSACLSVTGFFSTGEASVPISKDFFSINFVSLFSTSTNFATSPAGGLSFVANNRDHIIMFAGTQVWWTKCLPLWLSTINLLSLICCTHTLNCRFKHPVT